MGSLATARKAPPTRKGSARPLEDMPITASRLRESVYRILDRVLETGLPMEIERKGRILRIVPAKETSRLSRLKRRRLMKCDPEEIVHLDWSSEWRP